MKSRRTICATGSHIRGTRLVWDYRQFRKNLADGRKSLGKNLQPKCKKFARDRQKASPVEERNKSICKPVHQSTAL